MIKGVSSTHKCSSILRVLSTREESGTPGVTVECVDIRKNTRGEGGSLARC